MKNIRWGCQTKKYKVFSEKYYKIFLIGIFIILSNDYIRLSERETGTGRADLILEPKNKENPAYIFEFKVAKDKKELENYAVEGFYQIKEKKYDVELKNKGINETIYVGLVFYRKEIKMKYEKRKFWVRRQFKTKLIKILAKLSENEYNIFGINI